MTTTKLDDISTAIERAVKALRGQRAPAKKRMKLDEFMTFALAEIEKAAQDEPGSARNRLVALKRSVDTVIAGVAKMSAEDAESEDIDIEVTTAFAPTKVDGDAAMDDVTTTGDQSSTETALATVTSATGDSAFAENLAQVAKAIEELRAGPGTLANEKPRARAKKRGAGERDSDDRGDGGGEDHDDGEHRERDADGWPLDLATDEFLQGDAAADTAPVWGADPAGLASTRGR